MEDLDQQIMINKFQQYETIVQKLLIDIDEKEDCIGELDEYVEEQKR